MNTRSRGQVLVIVAFGITTLIVMVGLVIDGGYAWGRQRMTQSGADAVAEAGATVIAQNGAGTYPLKTDGDVGCAIEAAATANHLEDPEATYTDWQGNFLSPSVVVGACAAGAGAPVPAAAGGVKATGSQTFDTFLIRIVGINTSTAHADATAVTGILSGCPAGANCPLVPVTIATAAETCDDTGEVLIGTTVWPIVDPADADATNEVNVELCTVVAGHGNFGGLDLGEPGCDSKELFSSPCQALVPIPSWLQTSTGDIGADITYLNQYYAGPILGVADDGVILVPMHDNTCLSDPADSTPPPCSDGDWSGAGNSTYYHVPYLTGFMLDRAFSDTSNCDAAPGQPLRVGGNDSDSCIKGWFVKLVLTGPVGGPASGDPQDPAAIGVQLIN